MFSDACSFPQTNRIGEESVVLTGGWDPSAETDLSSVQVYGLNGLINEFAPLKQARSDHGCGYFLNEAGIQVKVKV